MSGRSHLRALPQAGRARLDKLCQIRSVTHTNADHTVSTHYLLTGMPPPPTNQLRLQWPHVGSVLSRMGRGRGALPPFISMRPKLENDVPRFVEQSQGQFAGWLGPIYDPLTIDGDPEPADYRVGELAQRSDLPTERLDSRRHLRQQLDAAALSTRPAPRPQDANRERAYALLAGAEADRNAFKMDEDPLALRESCAGLIHMAKYRCCASAAAGGTRRAAGDRLLAQ
jgi:hypothetical protein